MDYRALTVSATLAFTGLAGLAAICRADIIASQDGIAVRDAGVAAPARGMTMSQVANKFGAPVTKIPAVGNPPISRWDYPGFVVYFERDHVIHSVVSEAAPGEAAPTAAAPAPAVDQAPAPSPPAESEAPPTT
jgi:outer membrane protein assembly factor BamE (lipoprotein component of BamABCDE complex)